MDGGVWRARVAATAAGVAVSAGVGACGDGYFLPACPTDSREVNHECVAPAHDRSDAADGDGGSDAADAAGG
jgi:hypothetical protein